MQCPEPPSTCKQPTTLHNTMHNRLPAYFQTVGCASSQDKGPHGWLLHRPLFTKGRVSRHGPGAQVLADADASHQHRLNCWCQLLQGRANHRTAEPTTTL